jgi:putative phosphoribosyl transferase
VTDAPPYRDRTEAGRALARLLAPRWAGRPDVLVLALPRGGVPVAYEVAKALDAPLDVFLVRKLGVPGHPELAMGAIASGGTRVLNEEVVATLGIPSSWLEAVAREERAELERRAIAFRGRRPPPAVAGRVVLVVDDGLATGSTMRAAVRALRRQRPASIVVAVPVGVGGTCEALAADADEVVCATTPDPFVAVGQGYEDFTQTSDEQVRDLLARAAHARPAAGSAS